MEDGDDYYYDMIAPNTQNLELQDEAEGAQDLHPDLTESYDLSEDIGIPSTAANSEQPILNEVSDDEYRHMVQILNKEQKQFFYHILHLIKTFSHPFYCSLRPRLYGEKLSRVERSPAYPSYPGRANFS